MESEAAELRRLGARLLGQREYSCQTLRNKLTRLTRYCRDPDLIDQVLTELAQQGLQSDARYAESLVRKRLARGQGPERIRRDLKRDGIAEALIRKLLNIGEARWCALAEQARARHYGRRRPDNPGEQARQARFLSARGFTEEHISRLFRDSFPDP